MIVLFILFSGDRAAYRDEVIKHGGINHLLSLLSIPDLSTLTVSFIHNSLFKMRHCSFMFLLVVNSFIY